MSRVPAGLLLVLFFCSCAAGQISAGFSNGPELQNGTETLNYFTLPSIGNVPGQVTLATNLTPQDQLFFQVLPHELMYSSNGTAPGTLEFVGQEVLVYYSYWNNPSGALPVVYDQEIYSVTTLPDGRRVPTSGPPLLQIAG